MTAAMPIVARRHFRTVGEWAQRWHMQEDRARMFLRDFEKRGYVERCGRYWAATERALALHLDGDPV